MQKTKSIALILGVLAMSFLVGYLVLAWTEPTTTPPGGNVPAPLNVGSVDQIKSGGLSVGAFISRFGTILARDSGNVGIGTANPSQKLDISGNVYTTGNINAPNNTWDGCAWTAYTCDASQTCANGKFVAGVDRYTTGSLCGSGTDKWYQMRLYCCGI
jgi:hypothetical protein